MEHKHDRRVIVYPAYLNSKLTVREGRRIPASLATDNPSTHEVMESVLRLGFKAEIEDKSYSRDYMVRGRVRVELRGESGEPANEEIPNRRMLLIKIAELVPTTTARQRRGDSEKMDEPIGLPKLLKPKEERKAQKTGKKKK
mmetsp:Transcript_28662/g.54895  ORF Transcript_28662/g.54895 Transcript_28662/m.54895 type:complete len:142 (+) Transcript_28662:194-619(+)|eukprot:CAMPEP_0114257410 /NCGR_PEP_ID=MMETSP0058-20121206/18715_1 /TAXON_ID=36894 /ORGANISM="Pyramimonas parkeae, CCMP726" /LENGTH=141 /DNA_ID=CAMNT_0001372129 /DNA_START=194 /DNA_END=619 /DNA_ORIENTATION=-